VTRDSAVSSIAAQWQSNMLCRPIDTGQGSAYIEVQGDATRGNVALHKCARGGIAMSISTADQPGESDEDPNAEGKACYASPPCYAHEVDPAYFSGPVPMQREELIAFLNTLLEAERAGAKTIAYYLQSDCGETLRPLLTAVGHDESRYAALLARLVREQGGIPSMVTGSFFDKARTLGGTEERLTFLNRGQGWVVRKLAEVLPRLTDPSIRTALAEMHEVHLQNIKKCENVV
jgi:hypothetical protein